jgi:hypothetical protein
MAKKRIIQRDFAPTHQSKYRKLLVSGCSFTFNNHDSVACSWPYYLRDLANFDEVYDCSQSGAGSNHIFNSVINEIETNREINPDDTLVIVMWSGLTRTDVITEKEIVHDWHHMGAYRFDDVWSTMSIFNQVDGNSEIDKLCRQYKKIISPTAQIYESCLKIIALESYLKQKKFQFIFTSWMDPTPDLCQVSIGANIKSMIDKIDYLGDVARASNMQEIDGHPNPAGYLHWTRDYLIPYLTEKQLATDGHAI